MRKTVSVLGHFAEGKNLLNGQTIKTKIVTEELQHQIGENQVLRIDTHGGVKTLLKAPFDAYRALKSSTNVLIFPAHNGLRVYAPLLVFLRIFLRKRSLHYAVIGGWLPHFLEKRATLKFFLKKFDGIYVETNSMKKALDAQGFTNVFVMPNCKKLTVLSENELVYPNGTPYKLCTFSRVMKEKGIEDAVEIIRKVNAKLGYQAYTLDIFGQIDSSQAEWFESLKQRFNNDIKYCGSVDPNRSVEVLKDYFALLFPTHYYTEGIPGTIIDAYAAGVPVIAARWQSFDDVVDDGKTGVCYEFDNAEQLEKILLNVEHNLELFQKMKKNCIIKGKRYIPETAVRIMLGKIMGI